MAESGVPGALRQLGERISSLETTVREGQEETSRRISSVETKIGCVEDGAERREIRLAVLEAAWREQVAPAIQRLDDVRMTVAKSAWLSGGIVGAAVILIEVLAKVLGWK